MKRTIRTKARKGIAAVEFAIVLPWLFVFLLGIWEVGRVIHVRHTLMAGAREAGRQAAAGMPVDQVVEVVNDYLSNADLPTGNVAVTVNEDWTLATGESACRVTVSIPIADIRWVLLHRFTDPESRVTSETVWPRS